MEIEPKDDSMLEKKLKQHFISNSFQGVFNQFEDEEIKLPHGRVLNGVYELETESQQKTRNKWFSAPFEPPDLIHFIY